MATLFNVFVKATAILLLYAAAASAQTADKPVDSDSTDIRVLEERVRQNEHNTQDKLEAIRNEMEYRDSARIREIELRAKELENRIDLYFWGGSIVLGFIVFLLTFLGAKSVATWIKDKINEKVNEITERELETTWGDIFQKFAEQKTEEYESSLTERLNKLEKEREEYLRLKNDLLEMKDTLAMKEASSKERAGKYAEFEDRLESIKREDQYSSHDWLIKGYSEYSKGNHGKAIEYYSKAIEKDPKNAIAYNSRGLSYSKLEEHKNAIDDHNKAIELEPREAMSYNFRGICYDDLKEHKKAIEDYSKAIELEPEYIAPYNNRGLTYNNLKEYKNAIDDVNKAIELDPENAALYNNRGYIYDNLKEYKKAIDDYNKAIELDPTFYEPLSNLATGKIISGDYADALKNVEKALTLTLDNMASAILYYKKCIITKLLGFDTTESEKAFTAALEREFVLQFYFDAITDWFSETDLPTDTRKFIEEKTEMLKKKMK